jgi:hypothetical protein
MITVEFEGTQHEFPDDFTQDEISNALSSHKPAQVHPVQAAVDPVLRIPRYARREQEEGLARMRSGAGRVLDFGSTSAVPESVKGLGEMALGGVEYLSSWPSAALHSIVGQPIQETSEAPLTAALGPTGGKIGSQLLGGLAETGAGFVMPEVALPGASVRVPKLPEAVEQRLGVTLTKGEAASDPVQIAREEAARAGRLGEVAQRNALDFDAQRSRELSAATESTRGSLDPQGNVLAAGPREAGEIAQEAVQQQAKAAKARTDALFTGARSYDTEVEADIFRGMGSGIRRDIYQGTDPVIIDNALTPNAAAMVKDLNSQPEALARRLGQKIAEGETITGLPLEMVDRIRRRLSGFRRGAAQAAFAGRSEDLRAAERVMEAFDERIDRALDQGLFTGDPRALQAWKDARAAHTDYRNIFTRFSNDPVGRVIEKVVGRRGTDALIPEKVADHLYGASFLKPTTENVQVATRFKQMLEPEQWAAVQQGHFSQLIERGPDVTPYSHREVADRIDKFLNHSMANVIYTPAQRSMLKSYADLRRTLHAEPAGLPVGVARMSDRIAQRVGGHVGGALGSAAGELAGGMIGAPGGHIVGGSIGRYAAEKLVARRPAARAAREIAKEMPVIGKVWQDYQNAVSAYEASRTPRNIARVTLAVRNLDRNLRNIGTSFQEMQQPAPPQLPAPQQPPPQQLPAPQQGAAPQPRPTVALPPGVMSGAPLSGGPTPLSGGPMSGQIGGATQP